VNQSGCRKRDIGNKESQQEKHKSAEKKRRSDMNDLIERLKSLLPPRLPSSCHVDKDKDKATKITILQEVVEYFSRIQTLALQLLKENSSLHSELTACKKQIELLQQQIKVDSPYSGGVFPKKRKADPFHHLQQETKKNIQNYVVDGSRAVVVSTKIAHSLFS
jgi:uncharacterized protein with von Willebrand factor type A (vWA) domain